MNSVNETGFSMFVLKDLVFHIINLVFVCSRKGIMEAGISLQQSGFLKISPYNLEPEKFLRRRREKYGNVFREGTFSMKEN